MLDLIKHNPQSSPHQTNPEEDQYLTSLSPSNQFTNNVKSNNKDNNAVTTIERLFLSIEYRLSYKRLTKKAIHEICKFFVNSARDMGCKDRLALCRIKLGLRPF